MVKRHGHLIERIADRDNLIAAHQAARVGKTWQNQVKAIDQSIDRRSAALSRLLLSGNYRTGRYTTTIRNERGKQREIWRLPYWPDRVVQHAICQVAAPIWMGSLIRGTYSSLPGRGIHDASRRLRSDLREHPAETAWCAKADVRKFYPSIEHDLMLDTVARKIKCQPTLSLIEGIIRSADVSAPGVGLPIGNYLSQWLANLFLARVDHVVAARSSGYHRYCDDIAMLAPAKGAAHDLRDDLAIELQLLGLTMRRDWRVFASVDGIDFAGYVHRQSHTLLRKSIKKRMAKRLTPKRSNTRRSAAAYNGWVRHGNTRNLRHAIVSPRLTLEEAQ
jgi:hypothetical protein